MWIIGFFLGTILGSFVKAIADRSLTTKTFWERSYCPHCKHKLQWYDLLPIVSYIILRGKCRYCGDSIGGEYLLVEGVMGILIGFLFWQSFQNFNYTLYPIPYTLFLPDLIFKTFFIIVLAILFLTDLKKMLIPDRVVIPAIWVSITFITVITINQTRVGQLLLLPLLSVVSAIIIAGFFMALIWITKGKGMGGGDVKLGAFMGLGLGFPNALVALILAFFTGALWGLGAIILGKKRFGQHIPFGPFLVLGSLISLFWGEKILDWYLKLG